ncbi:response regulator [Natronococcus sp. A-GB7]|uniref:response regulator n=1 Tax=Natronococcus sp. A-GB7 TaxID=3037649 RepID=UPI00241E1D94|nr:response regulator [Natronococcus sp. A-GB7]MDG5819266.1 response regulator [Natronococcus sp. A-GB7]
MGGPKHVGEILLAEDNPGDVRLTREMFENADLRGNYHVVTDGAEALEFLERRGEYESAPRPDLVLLDWHFPKKSGKEVLRTIRADEELREIPVVVLTGTQPELKKLQSEPPQADAYVLKPLEAEECRSLVEKFCSD